MNTVEVEIFRHPIYSAYAADKFGDIYSLKFGKINMIRSRVSKEGYLRFNICLGGSRKTYLSHRFVFECVNNRLIEKNKQIDHINHDKKDNNITNLREVSVTTNSLNKFNHKEVEKLPDDVIKVIQYNSHKFKGYYFSPTTNCLYRYSDDYLFEIPFKSRNRATVYNTENCPIRISLYKLRKMLGYQ